MLSRRRSLARLFRDSRRMLALSIAIAIAQSALLVPVAFLVKHAFDEQIPQGDTGGLLVTGIVLLVLYLASAGLSIWTRYAVLRVTSTSFNRLCEDLFARVYGLPKIYFDRADLGVLHSTLVQDTQRLETMSHALLSQVMPGSIVAACLATVLLVLDPVLFLLLLVVVPLLLALGRWLGRQVRERTREWHGASDVFSRQAHLALRGMASTKVQAAEPEERERRRVEAADVAETRRQMAWRQSAYSQVQQAVAASAGVVVLIVGGRAVAAGDMTLGELLSFYAVVALLLRQVGLALNNMPYVLSGLESMTRLERILAERAPEPYHGTASIDFKGAVSLECVGFGYGDTPLLHEVSFSIVPGEHVALVGPNGAGKSTLLSLMLGLYRPTEGRLLADGVPYDGVDLAALRRRIGVVLQDPFLFPGTIAENIAFGHPGASRDDIRRAAARASASAFIEALPEGYDTQVGDEAGLLSGGERQRVAIARALVSDPVLLMLDEPTNHLDDESIAELMRNLRELPGSPGIVLITHDTAVAREADTIHYLRDGRLVADELPSSALGIGGAVR